jgi:hypothetical protein
VDTLGYDDNGNITELDSYDFSTDVDWSKVGAASAEGAINGAVVVTTGRAGLVTTAAATATAGVAGGMVKRAINGETIIDPTQMTQMQLQTVLGNGSK